MPAIPWRVYKNLSNVGFDSHLLMDQFLGLMAHNFSLNQWICVNAIALSFYSHEEFYYFPFWCLMQDSLSLLHISLTRHVWCLHRSRCWRNPKVFGQWMISLSFERWISNSTCFLFVQVRASGFSQMSKDRAGGHIVWRKLTQALSLTMAIMARFSNRLVPS